MTPTESCKKWRSKHFAQEKERRKEYYDQHRQEEIAYSKRYRLENLEEVREAHRRYQKKNAKKEAQRKKEWREANPEKYKAYMKDYSKRYHLQKKYGLSIEQYEFMLSEQNDCCAICGIKFDRTQQATKPCVDHNHTTGKLRKILCNNCNSLLGYADEKIETLKKAIIYLKESEQQANSQQQ